MATVLSRHRHHENVCDPAAAVIPGRLRPPWVQAAQSIFRKKPTPDLIRGGIRFPVRKCDNPKKLAASARYEDSLLVIVLFLLNLAAREAFVQDLQRRMAWIAPRPIHYMGRRSPAMHSMAA